jgi:hypothetical protein
MTELEYRRFEHDAIHKMQVANDKLIAQFKLGSYQDWNYDADKGLFTFSSQGRVRVRASFQFIGSFSRVTNSWLWAWGNESLADCDLTAAHRVRAFGEEHNLPLLANAYLEDFDESHSWSMASVAGVINNAQGAYRCPTDNGATYVLLNDTHFVE